MKTTRLLSIAILVLVAVCNLYFGIRMIQDPSGASVGLSHTLLRGSMFSDFYIPGWILVSALGLFALLAIALVLKNNRYYPVVIIVQGVLVIVCVVVQMVILGNDNFLQYFFLMTGMFLIVLGAFQYQLKRARLNSF